MEWRDGGLASLAALVERGGDTDAASAVAVGLASGGRVQTRRGETLVQDLTEGDEILTAAGKWAVIKRIEWDRLSDSVRIRRDAFGPAEPHRDVSIGAAQVVSIGSGPVEARDLIDQVSVFREHPGQCRFYRLTLDRPGFALVEGLAAQMSHASVPAASVPIRRDRLQALAAV